MKIPLFVIAVLTVVVQAAEVKPATPEKDSWEKYQLLTSRNIFDRSRRGPRKIVKKVAESRPAVKEVVKPPVNTDTFFVLTGVVKEGDLFIAFMEDTQGKKIFKAKTGDDVGKGRIASIELGCINYLIGETTKKIIIGNNLAGGAETERPEVSGKTADTSEASGSTGSNTRKSMNPADILERMRKRRKQELK